MARSWTPRADSQHQEGERKAPLLPLLMEASLAPAKSLRGYHQGACSVDGDYHRNPRSNRTPGDRWNPYQTTSPTPHDATTTALPHPARHALERMYRTAKANTSSMNCTLPNEDIIVLLKCRRTSIQRIRILDDEKRELDSENKEWRNENNILRNENSELRTQLCRFLHATRHPALRCSTATLIIEDQSQTSQSAVLSPQFS